jgi:D-alanyl-D-alanine carboxypeptidase
MKLGRPGRTIVAVALGTSIMVAAETLSEDAPAPAGRVTPPDPPTPDAPTERLKEPVRTVLLAWTPGGLPPGSESRIEEIDGVRDATTVVAGLEWISTTEKSDGSKEDILSDGLGIPFEVAIIEPEEYARFVSPAEAPIVAALEPGQLLMPETGEDLRGGGRGLWIATSTEGGGPVSRLVTGVVSDRATNGYEALVAGPPPPGWPGTDRFVLARLSARAAPRSIETEIRKLLGPGGRLRVRLQGESPYLRYGDAVLPQLIIKAAFGEFAAEPSGGGTVRVDDLWREASIREGRVPILGNVTCHRRLFPQLVDALTEVRSAGLAYLIDPGDYGGCYSPRFVASSGGPRLSHHSWGIAIDINVAENAFGTKADQDPRLVEIFERHGFTWGGRWLIPDGMHFEWASFP